MSRFRLFSRSGQAVVLLLALLVAMATLAFWILDIRTIVMRRLFTQDGGDAAALAAARWQAAGLNLCGELNLIQAYMLADDRENIHHAQALHELRLRLQLVCPVLAVHAAQTVASENGLQEIPAAADYIRDFRDAVLLEGFYPGAEADLRELLDLLTEEPITAFPACAVYEESDFHNYLLDQDFYEAVLSRNWCWFKWNSLLRSYVSRKSFGPLPKLRTAPFFDLRLTTLESSLDDLTVLNTLSGELEALGHPALPKPPVRPSGSSAEQERYADHIRVGEARELRPICWTIYREDAWGPWEAMAPGELPIDGQLREEYDYDGANVAVSVQNGPTTWLAAAKAFGSIDDENPTVFGLVLGGFDTVRLIPIDAADVGIIGFDFVWLNHLRNHLPAYVKNGTKASGCRYCRALERWEDPAFRHDILIWLAEYGHTCVQPRPGRGSSGGSRYGH